jgi:exosortase/archaeosortase family protein
MNERTALLAWLAASWSSVLWMLERATAGEFEASELVACAAFLLVLWRTRRAAPEMRPGLFPASLALALAACATTESLPLIAAVGSLSALCFLGSPRRFGCALHLPTFGLAMLALPVMPHLQFYLGYPLRLATAALAVPLLRGAGFAVSRAGTGLQHGDGILWVDAPCSGIRMLWAAAFLLCVLAIRARLGSLAFALGALGTLVLVVCGNALRAAALFFAERAPEHGLLSSHEALGLAVFALTGGAIVLFVSWLSAANQRSSPCAA